MKYRQENILGSYQADEFRQSSELIRTKRNELHQVLTENGEKIQIRECLTHAQIYNHDNGYIAVNLTLGVNMKNGKQSPAITVAHELGHALEYYDLKAKGQEQEYLDNVKEEEFIINDVDWGDPEEYRNIHEVENKVIDELNESQGWPNKEAKRTEYNDGKLYSTTGPMSQKPVDRNKVKPKSYYNDLEGKEVKYQTFKYGSKDYIYFEW